MSRRASAWAVLALSWLSAATSSAAEAPAADATADPPALLHLAYDRAAAASGCQTPEELSAAVEARLGRRVFVPEQSADLVAEVRAYRRARRYVITVTLFDASRRRLGERRLETRARHCSALDDSLALVLSLAADVRRPPAAPSSTEPVTPASPPPAPLALSTPVVIPETAHAPRAEVVLSPSLGVAFGVGLLPHLAVGAQARLGLVVPRFWPVVVDATWWHGQRLGDEQGARFALETLRLGVCPWQLAADGLELSVCVDELFGALRAEGFGFDERETVDRWLAAVGAGATASYSFGPGFVSASGSLLVPFVQRRYFYTDGEQFNLYESPWALGTFTISVGLEI
jgi:hypothetical protein